MDTSRRKQTLVGSENAGLAVLNTMLLFVAVTLALMTLVKIGTTENIKILSLETLVLPVITAVGGFVLLVLYRVLTGKSIDHIWRDIKRFGGRGWWTIILMISLFPLSAATSDVYRTCYRVPGASADIAKKEIKILVPKTWQTSGNLIDVHLEQEPALTQVIQQMQGKVNVSLQLVDRVIKSDQEARELSECYKGTFILWSITRAAGVEMHFVMTPRWATTKSTSGQLVMLGSVEELGQRITPGKDTQYIFHFLASQIFFQDARFDFVIPETDAALALMPAELAKSGNLLLIYNARVGVYLQQRKESLIITEMEELLGKGLIASWIYDYLGIAYIPTDPNKAISYFETALTVKADDLFARLNMGGAYFVLNNIPKAAEQFDYIITKAPRSVASQFSYYYRGLIFKQRGDLNQAARELEYSLFPDKESAYLLDMYDALGEVYFLQKRYVDAYRMFQTAQAISKDYPLKPRFAAVRMPQIQAIVRAQTATARSK